MINPLKAFRQGYTSSKDIEVDASGGSINPASFGFNVSYGNKNFSNLTDLAVKNPLSRRAIDFIADNLANIPLKLVEVSDDGEEEQIGSHPILDLLSRPGGPNNDRYTKEWLFTGKVWSMMGGGEYWLRGVSPDSGSNEGMPRKLQLFDRSDFNHFITDGQGFVSGYDLNLEQPYGSKNIQGDTEEILHSFNYHPKRKERGLPILLSVLRALSIMEDNDNWNKNISENRGQVPGFLMPRGLDPGDQIGPQDRDQAQEQVDEQINQGRKGHKWTVLGGAFEPINNNITPKEASFLKSMKYYGRLVVTGLGVDPSLLGDNSAQTYDNYSTALIIAYTTRIIPMLEFFLSDLNRWLVPKFEDDNQTLRLTFDPMRIDALREAMLEKIEALTNATDAPILTPDDARKILGYKPIGADSLVVPMNVQPHEQLFGGPDSDININMSELDTKSDEDIMEEIERIANGKVKVDKHRRNGAHV
jgi:HK97 family phage portal protein